MSQVSHERALQIAEEASIWLERLERSISHEEGTEFRRWLKLAPHREAVVDRCKRWHGPEILAVLGELIPVETFRQRVERHYGKMVLLIFFCVSALGFATVMIAFSKLWPWHDEHENPLRAEAEFRTAVGERKTIRLPDGGSVVMNGDTQLQFTYMPHSRDILLIRGEALFDARADPERPFVVMAGVRSFVATSDGTLFNVDRVTQENAELTVVRGNVFLPASWSRAEPSAALLRKRVTYGSHEFGAGEGGTIGLAWQEPRPISTAELLQRIAWQRREISADQVANERAR